MSDLVTGIPKTNTSWRIHMYIGLQLKDSSCRPPQAYSQDIQDTYSIEFSTGWSISKTLLFILCKTISLYFFYCLPHSQILLMRWIYSWVKNQTGPNLMIRKGAAIALFCFLPKIFQSKSIETGFIIKKKLTLVCLNEI